MLGLPSLKPTVEQDCWVVTLESKDLPMERCLHCSGSPAAHASSDTEASTMQRCSVSSPRTNRPAAPTSSRLPGQSSNATSKSPGICLSNSGDSPDERGGPNTTTTNGFLTLKRTVPHTTTIAFNAKRQIHDIQHRL